MMIEMMPNTMVNTLPPLEVGVYDPYPIVDITVAQKYLKTGECARVEEEEEEEEEEGGEGVEPYVSVRESSSTGKICTTRRYRDWTDVG